MSMDNEPNFRVSWVGAFVHRACVREVVVRAPLVTARSPTAGTSGHCAHTQSGVVTVCPKCWDCACVTCFVPAPRRARGAKSQAIAIDRPFDFVLDRVRGAGCDVPGCLDHWVWSRHKI